MTTNRGDAQRFAQQQAQALARRATHHPGPLDRLLGTVGHGLSSAGSAALHLALTPDPQRVPQRELISRGVRRLGRAQLERGTGLGNNQTGQLLAHPERIAHALQAFAHKGAERYQEGGAAQAGGVQKQLRIASTPYQVGRALVEHPSAIGKTAKGLGEFALAAPAGVVQAVADPAQAVKAASRDVSRRYGPLARGDAKAFRARIGKEGAAAEIADIGLVGGSEAAVLGRSAGKVARAGALGPRAQRFAGEARPELRISGNVTRRQELAPNIFRVAAQRAEDRARRVALEGSPAAQRVPVVRRTRVAKGRVGEAGRRGIQPGGLTGPAHEVVPLFQKRAMRVARSQGQSQHFQAFRNMRTAELRGTGSEPGAHRAIAFLNKHQKRAVVRGVEGTVPLHSPEAAIAFLRDTVRPAEVAHYQARGFKGEPPSVRQIDYLIEHAHEIFTPGFRKFQAREAARTQRLSVADPGVNDLTAEVHRHRKQGHLLGIQDPYETLAAELDRRHEVAKAARLTERQTASAAKKAEQAALQRVGAARRKLASATTEESFRKGRAVGPVTAEDRALLRGDEEYVQASRARNAAARELQDARKAYGNAARNPRLYSDAEMAHQTRRLHHAETAVHEAHAIHGVASAQAAERLAAQFGRQPARVLTPLERAGGRTLEAQRELAQAKRDLEHVKAHHRVQVSQARAARVHAENANSKTARRQLDTIPPELAHSYIAAVRERARRAGLPEPGYVKDFKHRAQVEALSPSAIGGASAAPGVRRSTLALFKQGRRHESPEAYLQSVNVSLKRTANWHQIAHDADIHSFPPPSVEELRHILGRENVDPAGLTADEWRSVLEAKGLDPKDYAVWRPGKFRRNAQTLDTGEPTLRQSIGERQEGMGSESIASLVREGFSPELPPPGTDFERGVRLIPRPVYNEINSGASLSGIGGRLLDKYMGTQSRLLLGLSPSWLQIQVAANGFLAGIGMGGNVADFVRGQMWYHRLPPDLQKAADEAFGSGVGEAHGMKLHLGGAANSELVNWWRMFRSTAGLRGERIKGRIPVVRNVPGNPIDFLFYLDHHQNAIFKRAVFYNKAKRELYQQMARDGGHLPALADRITNILRVDPGRRIEALARNPRLFEQFAQHTDDVLGNYIRYTARERKTLKRGVLFYGFMRYALRTTFYTMPVKHPIVGALVAKLAQLHNEEVKDLLGGADAPWAFSRVFFRSGSPASIIGLGEKVPGSKGLYSVDLQRLNPVATPLTDVTTEGVKGFGGLFSPALQAALDQLYGKHLYSGKPLRVHGSPEEAKSIGGVDRLRILLADAGQTLLPYRIATQMTQPGEQSDEALLFSPRPIRYKTPEAIQKANRKRALKGSALDVLAHQLEPFLPRPDDSRATVANIQKKRRKGKGGPVDPIQREIQRSLQGSGASGDAEIQREIQRSLQGSR